MSNYKKVIDALALDASTDAVAMANALLAVADAIAAHNRPTPTVESPATGEPEPPAPVGVGSVLDGNTKVAADLGVLPEYLGVLPEYLTTAEVAEIVRTSPETVRYWRHVGKGPRSWKAGRRVLYRREDVEAWLQEQYEAGAQ